MKGLGFKVGFGFRVYMHKVIPRWLLICPIWASALDLCALKLMVPPYVLMS
jgi:hypothetical protein